MVEVGRSALALNGVTVVFIERCKRESGVIFTSDAFPAKCQDMTTCCVLFPTGTNLTGDYFVIRCNKKKKIKKKHRSV